MNAPSDPARTGPSPDPGDEPPSPAAAPAPRPTPARCRLVRHAHDVAPPAVGWLEPLLDRAAALLPLGPGVVNVVLVDDDEMAGLHEQYTGVPGTTDVLTFDHRTPGSADAGPSPDDDLADLVLCVDEAARQADDRGHDARAELLLYAVHGLLHLVGEDDHDDAAYARMHAREDALLEQLGVGAVFMRDERIAREGAGTC